MFLWLLISGIWMFHLVNTHPLIQNIQPFPIINYQHAYLPPYNDAFMVQPSNINLYSQPVTTQTPVVSQTLQSSSLKDITQMYWQKLLSDPSIRPILDSNNVCDHYGKYGCRNPNSCNIGGVVNNYIILPPDYLKINDTIEESKTKRVKQVSKRPVQQNVAANERKRKLTNNIDDTNNVNNHIILPPDYIKINDTIEKPKTKRVKQVSKIPVQQNVAANERKRKLTNNIDDTNNVNNHIILPPDYIKLNDTIEKPKTKRVKQVSKRPVQQNVATNERKRKLTNNIDNTNNVKSVKSSRKLKQNEEQSWSFNTQNIKCFTPVDVLKNEKYQPDNKGATKKCHNENMKKNRDSITNRENKNKSKKSRKVNKVKKEPLQNTMNEFNDIKDKKTKRSKTSSKSCKCEKGEKISDKTKIVEDAPKFCESDIDELLLSILMQQGCTDLENRCTRNSKTDSKTDTAKPDFLSMYPNLPGDISNTFNWYLNDLYSPQSLQQALNSNAFQGNKYPFDFSQIYQIPQYSNTDLNKSKGNTETNQNPRRKKKKKKNSKTKTRKESAINSDDNIQSDNQKNNQIPETIAQSPEVNSETLEKITQTPGKKTQYNETIIAKVNSDTPGKINHTNFESKLVVNYMNKDTKPIDLPLDLVEKITTEHKQDLEETISDEILKTTDDNAESEEESKELYETQIPNSVSVYTNNENNSDVPESKEIAMDEMLPILGFDIFNQHPGFESDDEIFNMYMNDYYPDFRADNHAYLEPDEEVDFRNIHGRYFYATDKYSDSWDIYSTEKVKISDNDVVNDDKLGNLLSEHGDNKNEVNKKEEIVFRTPPALDVPDFITRKVNRNTKDSTELFYQHNNVDDFDRFNLDNFDDNNSNNPYTTNRNDNSGQIVETVYAKSKVIKYGQGQEVNKSKPEPKTVIPKEEITIAKDGTTVVLAKSLSPDEFW